MMYLEMFVAKSIVKWKNFTSIGRTFSPGGPGVPSVPRLPLLPSRPGSPSAPGIPGLPGFPSRPEFPASPFAPGGLEGGIMFEFNFGHVYI